MLPIPTMDTHRFTFTNINVLILVKYLLSFVKIVRYKQTRPMDITQNLCTSK